VTSVLDLFTIGIGPSSSHTVGPMRAARRFAEALAEGAPTRPVARLRIALYGSLALTGRGHGTDKAVVLGFAGHQPDMVGVDTIDALVQAVRASGQLPLHRGLAVPFDERRDLIFHRDELLPRHSNGMRFEALDAEGQSVLERVYYSIGGGAVVGEGEGDDDRAARSGERLPFAWRSGEDLLRLAAQARLKVSDMTLENERGWRSEAATRAALLRIWGVMQECVERGCHTSGILPGALQLARRAPRLYQELTAQPEAGLHDPLTVIDWVSLYAMAVNEENAAGHRVVTAPTNGAAGIIPAVLHYYVRIHGGATDDAVVRFLLTAGAIGLLYKANASISGAEVGCQGEVGVACSMAAGALAEVLGGTVPQVENAAEIGMEHNLGLTCDPVGGLVQVPCIERNAMAAVKAINAARLALHGDGRHRVSLDKVIATMRETGADMSTKYKETARGGLAVNVIAC